MAIYAKPYKQIEQGDVQEVVCQMTCSKAKSFFHRWFCVESKEVRKDEVHDKTQCIANSICYGDVYPLHQQQVDAVMDNSCQATNYTESEHFLYFIIAILHTAPLLPSLFVVSTR